MKNIYLVLAILFPIVGVMFFGYYTDYETRNIHPVEIQTYNNSNNINDTVNDNINNNDVNNTINTNTVKLDLTNFSVDDNDNYIIKDKTGKLIDCYHFHKNLAGSYDICRVNHNIKHYNTYNELQDDVDELQNENDRLKSILDDNNIDY